MFTARQLYHTLFNPEGKRDYSYPGGYATIVKFTKAIQEDRPKKGGPSVPAAPAKAKGVSRPLMYFSTFLTAHPRKPGRRLRRLPLPSSSRIVRTRSQTPLVIQPLESFPLTRYFLTACSFGVRDY
jgi:hypothetical protein